MINGWKKIDNSNFDETRPEGGQIYLVFLEKSCEYKIAMAQYKPQDGDVFLEWYECSSEDISCSTGKKIEEDIKYFSKISPPLINGIRIIKNGKKEDKIIKFVCDECGCIWTADQTNYEINYFYDVNTCAWKTAVCRCPCCGELADFPIEGV